MIFCNDYILFFAVEYIILIYKTLKHILGLSDSSSNGSFVFNFQKVLVLTKTTRFDLVQYFNPSLSEKQVKELIVNQGLDLDEFLSKHLEHKRNEKSLLEALHNLDIQVKHVNRYVTKYFRDIFYFYIVNICIKLYFTF